MVIDDLEGIIIITTCHFMVFFWDFKKMNWCLWCNLPIAYIIAMLVFSVFFFLIIFFFFHVSFLKQEEVKVCFICIYSLLFQEMLSGLFKKKNFFFNYSLFM